MKNSNKKYGFTLIELMVAVIIIAVLAAVAVPQYKKAVLKSRFSTLMPLAQSVAKGNEVYYLANGEYADRKDKLDVEGPGTTPEGTQVNVVDSEDYNYVIASRNSLPNNYIVYQAHSPKFAGNIHCEAEDGNTTAMELCKSLGGQEIGGSQTDGYVTYVLEGTQGDDDKLPSSLTKLAATICAGIAEENCIIDDNSRTITTQECGPVPSQEVNCISTRYNAEGEMIGTSNIMCKNGTTPNADKTHCEGLPNDTSSMYEDYYTYYDDGTIRQQSSRGCTKIRNGQCTETYEYLAEHWPNGKRKSSDSYRCATVDLQEGGGCSTYTALTGNIAAHGTQSKYNERGDRVWEIQCTRRQPDGTCTSLKQGTIWTYNGTTQTGFITASCTTSHLYDTNPCTRYLIGPSDGTATYCDAANFNFDTFECASES